MNSKAFFYGVLSYDHMMALGLAMKNVQDQKLEMNGDTLMASLRACHSMAFPDARIWPRVQTTARSWPWKS